MAQTLGMGWSESVIGSKIYVLISKEWMTGGSRKKKKHQGTSALLLSYFAVEKDRRKDSARLLVDRSVGRQFSIRG